MPGSFVENLPAELLLQIFQYVAEASYADRVPSSTRYKSLRGHRTARALKREEQCVLLTQTCRAFKEPALAVLWRSIKISPMNIHLVADAVRFGWHRMHSVRNIKFESTPIGHSREDVELVMRQLPRLDNLQVHRSDPRPSPYKCGDFFDVLFMRPDLQISTRELDLSFKSELFDLSKILSHFQHLEHLTLAVDRQGSKYSKAVIQPLTALQLKTLSLYLPPEPQTEDEPIINLFRTLAPACMHLQELCITIDEHAYPFLHRFFTLSKLGASTIHTVEFKVLADKMLELNSTVNPAAIISPQLSLERFIASTAPQSNLERRLPSLPALRHLKLTEFGCTHEMMAALDPAKLQTLHLVVPPKQGSFAGWAECADDVVKSIEGLKELEHIVVEFGILPGVPAYRQAFWGNRYNVKKAWSKVKSVCKEKEVELDLRLPGWEEEEPTHNSDSEDLSS